jgi:hypothetical protein
VIGEFWRKLIAKKRISIRNFQEIFIIFQERKTLELKGKLL